MLRSHKQKAILAIIVAYIIGGATSPIFKWSLESIQPFTLGFLRFFIASIVLLPFVAKNLKLDKKSLPMLVLTTIVSIPLQVGLYLVGLQYAPSINVPIITASAPIFIIICAVLFLHEKKQIRIILGTLIGLIGILSIVISPVLQHGFDGTASGNLLFVLATFSGILQLFLLKTLYNKYSPMQLTFWVFILGQLTMLPMMLWEIQSPVYTFTLNIQSIIGILYGGIISAAGSWGLYIYAIKTIPASETGIFSYIEPFITVLVAFFLLGETITPTYIVGAGFVFVGIILAEGKLPTHPLHRLTNGLKSIV